MRKIHSYQGAYSKSKKESAHTILPTRHKSYAYHPTGEKANPRRPREASEAKSLWQIAFFPLAFLYYELLLRIALGEKVFSYFFYVLFFSLSAGFLFYSLCHLFKKPKAVRVATICVLAFFAVLFLVEFFCKQFFTFFMGMSVMFQSAGEMMRSYFGVAVSLVLKSFHIVLLYFVPLAVYCFVFREPISRRVPPLLSRIAPAVACVLCYGIAMLGVLISHSGIVTCREYYTSEFNITESSLRFGLVTGFRLDAQYLVFGTPKAKTPDDPVAPVVDPTTPSSNVSSSDIAPIDYGENKMDIDFDALIANTSDETLISMHKYFAAQPATKKNKYTGMFKGKNLIVITAEAFSHYVIDKDRTPTLYRLATKGIHFTNYYQPAWGVSTSDGEYSHLMGIVPKAGVNSMKASANNNVYFTLGNQMTRLGYLSLAYHNNSNTYYGRNLTHPNLGYSKFIAIGSGLEGLDKVWPRSDLQMMEHSVSDYINSDKQFNIYYMTVSGHMNYSFAGNAMSAKHRDEVADLDMSEAARAYLACNMELDQALEYTIKTLEEAGELENTVIVLSGDHYPYGLDGTGAIDELAGEGTEADPFEKYRSTLILWSGDMEEPVVVDKPCYSVDIIPTLSNLFGLEYDSRLLAGRDILSDAPGLVIFNDYSYLTELGRYNADTDTFTPNEGAQVPENYAQDTYWEARYIRSYSEKILFNDYYRKIGLEPPAGPEEN